MKQQIKDFAKLFDGYKSAFGQHNNFRKDNSGKVNGKAQVIRAPLNDSAIEHHLNGSGASLGIIPLKENDTCKFGAIDLDIKPPNPLHHTIEEIEDKVNKLSLPLVVCQSKSKGVHLYCFTQKEVPAELLVSKLKEWASMIGYGTAEIFPKQNYRVNDNDIGNWINLPYYNLSENNRYAINNKKQLSYDEFVEFANMMRISEEELQDFKIDNLDPSYSDAPPCLEILASSGVEEGNRNNGLYNFGVYFKNKYPDNWEDKLIEINGDIIKPVLSMMEMENVIKSINKKKYFYKCNEYPVCQHCNKTECFKRKFGIGASSEMDINFDNLTKYVSADHSSVCWYVEYQGKRIQITTDELLNQRLLQKKMLNVLNIVFNPMKQQKWTEKINQLLTTCEVIVDPEDASRQGQFKELLNSYLGGGTHSCDPTAILSDSLYLDEKNNKLYFKSINLFSYLKSKKFSYVEQEVWHWLKQLSAKAKQMKIKNKVERVWYIQAPEFYDEGDIF